MFFSVSKGLYVFRVVKCVILYPKIDQNAFGGRASLGPGKGSGCLIPSPVAKFSVRQRHCCSYNVDSGPCVLAGLQKASLQMMKITLLRGAENAGLEKEQDWKMRDQEAGLENAGLLISMS